MSPERLEATNYDTTCDIWSLGITAIQCATGEHPFKK
jgi:serine/threonine protein kinase